MKRRAPALILIAVGAALLAVVAVVRLVDNDPVNEPTPTPALIAVEFIPAGTTGERIVRRPYVRVEIGGGRTADPSYLLGRPEYTYLREGVTIADVRPGQVLTREHFLPSP